MDNSKINTKQVLLLSVLIGVLAIIVCVQYLIRPVYSEAVDYKKSTEKIEKAYESMQDQSAMFGISKAEFEKNQKVLNDKRQDMLELKKRNDLDTLITNKAMSNGLSVSHLKIGEIEEYTITIPLDKVKKSKKDKDKDKDKKDEPDISSYPGAELKYNSKKDNYYLEYKTGEYSCEMNYSVKGKYSQIQKFISELADNSSVGIKSFKMSNSNDFSEKAIYNADISVKINMAGDIPDMSYQGAGTDEKKEKS